MKKSLGVWGVFAIATGAMIGSGFFLLPGIAFALAGPAVILAYFLAAVLVVPALLSAVELATAMPRSGGTYFFVSRGMGPIAGIIDGIGAWIAMVAKSSFALVGIGYYISLVFGWGDQETMTWFIRGLAVAVALVLAGVNAYGTKETGFLQTLLVAGLVFLSGYFILHGSFAVDTARLTPFVPAGFPGGFWAILATAGLVFVSYAGLTKVASVAEEVVNPERTIPLGLFLALGVTTLIYVLGVLVVVGVMPAEQLAHNRTPLASAAKLFSGTSAMIVMAIAGVLAFVTTANAGILSASRYLYAMGRDMALPRPIGRLSKRETPTAGIIMSTVVIIVIVCSFDAAGIAKLASTFLLIEFAAVNLTVIVMRESQVGSYDPGFRSPAYPWVQIAGVLISATLIYMMGLMPLLFGLSLFVVALVWYASYAHGRTEYAAAIRHVLERIATEILSREKAGPVLDRELREIMKEKGLRDHDPLAELVTDALVIDLPDEARWDDLMGRAVDEFSQKHPSQAPAIREGLLEMGRRGQTPAAKGIALPHLRIDGAERYELIVARSRGGLYFPGVAETVHVVFILLGSTEDPQQHLRMLAGIASLVEKPDFLKRWAEADDEEALRAQLIPPHSAAPPDSSKK